MTVDEAMDQARVGLTAEALRVLLEYDPETGLFTWRNHHRGTLIGCIAGRTGKDSNGYPHLKVVGRTYKAHRLVWLYTHGRWPEHQIDHINGVRDDNRLANLREATHTENAHNLRRARVNNASGLLGVSKLKNGRWRASIRSHGKQRNLGDFHEPKEAHAAYLRAKAELHPFQTICKVAK